MSYTLTPFDGNTHGFTLTVDVRNRLDLAFIEFSLLGDASLLDIADSAEGRANELWTSCTFELFTKDDTAPAYVEYNFSFSGQWNCYGFDSYRSTPTEVAIDTPDIMLRKGTKAMRLSAVLPWDDINGKQGNLAAVLKFKDGSYSYWATTHTKEKPDFHAEDAFSLQFSEEQFEVPKHTGKQRAEGIIAAINEHNNS